LPSQRTKQFGTGEFTGLGAQVYHRACESCHGAGAEGNDRLRQPRLAGQHYGYLVKQVDAMIRGTRYNLNWDHAALLKSLTEQEIAGLADYVARQAPDSGTRKN
jgi:cytochrome c553